MEEDRAANQRSAFSLFFTLALYVSNRFGLKHLFKTLLDGLSAWDKEKQLHHPFQHLIDIPAMLQILDLNLPYSNRNAESNDLQCHNLQFEFHHPKTFSFHSLLLFGNLVCPSIFAILDRHQNKRRFSKLVRFCYLLRSRLDLSNFSLLY